MARKPKRKIFSHLVFLKAFREHRCILLYNETSLCFCFYCLFSYSHCEMGILLKGGGGGGGGGIFYIPPTGHLHDDAILLLRPETFTVLLPCAN